MWRGLWEPSPWALPQYQKAVKKARGRELLVHLHALDKKLALHALSHGISYCEGGNEENCYEDDGIELPTLQYFSFDADGLLNHTDASAAYTSRTGDVGLFVNWDAETGRRIETTCEGKECSSYFGCNLSSTKTCFGQPWEDDCPESGIEEIWSCNLDL